MCRTDLSFKLTSLFKIQGCKFHAQDYMYMQRIFHEVQQIMTEITVKVKSLLFVNCFSLSFLTM